ncbi:unnamed protein product [Miscanthus lutarioriparius]|uniref:Uncharacterized protein n=1 Tax=Miscanthus lutarioriparius TaxID=422564 RepID=A0A811RDQ2_9POAL|nr:unnamed protein product [Miscanthus lutarioriparius]
MAANDAAGGEIDGSAVIQRMAEIREAIPNPCSVKDPWRLSLAPSSPSRAPPSSSPASSKVALSLDTHVKVDQLGLQFGRCQRSSATMLLPQAPAAITLYRSLHKLNHKSSNGQANLIPLPSVYRPVQRQGKVEPASCHCDPSAPIEKPVQACHPM